MKGKKDYSEAGKTEIAGWTDRETGAENRKNIDEKRTAADSRKGEKAAADSMKKEKTAADSKKAERVEKPENMGRKKAAEGIGKGTDRPASFPGGNLFHRGHALLQSI